MPQKPDDSAVLKAAPELPQLSAGPMQAEQHQPNSDSVQNAPQQQAKASASGAHLQLPGMNLAVVQPALPGVPQTGAQSTPAAHDDSADVRGAPDAHEEGMSISPASPGRMDAASNSHTANAAEAPEASAHLLQRAVGEHPVPVAKNVSHSHAQKGQLQRPRPHHRPSSQEADASHDRWDTSHQPPEASFAGIHQSSDRSDNHNRAGSHGRASSHDRARSQDRGTPHDTAMPCHNVMSHDGVLPYDRTTPHDGAVLRDRAMPHDRYAEPGRQPHSYQPERPRLARRFSDQPSSSRSPERKRSRDPEHAPYYHKRPRTDNRQPAMPSQADHHRQLEILTARRDADRWASIRKQEERASSQSQSPASDKHGQVPNGRHPPRHMSESRFATHQEHSQSRSPSATARQASITPQPTSAVRLSHRHAVHDRAQADTHRDLHRGDPSHHPPTQYHDPSLRRNDSWSMLHSHSVQESGASRKYHNYGRHPQLSSLDAPPSLDYHSANDQDALQRRASSLHSSDAAITDAERHHNRAQAPEGPSDKSASVGGNRRRSFEPPPHTSQAQPAMHRQLSHDHSPEAGPRHHTEATRHASPKRSSVHERLQTQQQSEAAKLAAATKLAQNTGRLMARLCQAYGVPASAMGNGPMLKNEQHSGLLDRMSAAMRTAEAQACNAAIFTVTPKVGCA